MPKISVIVPVYKVECYLRRCVDSILAQTFTDFELILVDDGSPDNCGILCDQYAATDGRIHVIHKKNGGLSDARNAGIDWAFDNSDSHWLSFVDSDDWIHPRCLEALINGTRTAKKEIVVCSYERTERDSPEVNLEKLSPIIVNTEDFFAENPNNATTACGKLYRKDCFSVIRYPVGKLHEDDFVTYRILFKHKELAFIDQPLYAYYQNPNGITGTTWSPKRLDGIEGAEQQLEFFKKHDYKKAYSASEKLYAERLSMAIHGLGKMKEPSYQRQIKPLRKKLRKVLKGKKDWFKERPWLYESAYPKAYWGYWTIKGVMGRFKAKKRG
jgi:glycosyltransferase involved in cell wall biosynthesis